MRQHTTNESLPKGDNDFIVGLERLAILDNSNFGARILELVNAHRAYRDRRLKDGSTEKNITREGREFDFLFATVDTHDLSGLGLQGMRCILK